MNTQQRGKTDRLARRRMAAGRLTAPVNHGCRCVPCTQGWASYSYERVAGGGR